MRLTHVGHVHGDASYNVKSFIHFDKEGFQPPLHQRVAPELTDRNILCIIFRRNAATPASPHG